MNYNFQFQFVGKILDGTKRSTVRANRKDGKVAKAGEQCNLYTGMRTKQCRFLRTVTLVKVSRVEIVDYQLSLDGRACGDAEADFVAVRDGFSNWAFMFAWFKAHHDLPFRGHLMEW